MKRELLLLGAGMQGKAALFDLITRGDFTGIVAADADIEGLERFCRERSFGARVRCEPLDVEDDASLERLLRAEPDVVLDLLPVTFVERVASKVARSGAHLVNTCYVRPGVEEAARIAGRQGTVVLPEFGVDPGLDLLLLGDALGKVEAVEEIRSYGAGLPAPEISRCNPLRYKCTWNMEGVLGAYRREAVRVVGGEIESIAADELFAQANIHPVEVEGVGALEAYPNGDATSLARQAGIDPAGLSHLGCYTMRWPGHAALWKPLVDLGLLDEGDVEVDGRPVSRRRLLAAALEPTVRLSDDERDVVIVRVEVTGRRGGEPVRIVNQLIDYRDLDTGFTAMNRTVGFTASIGAQLLASGKIPGAGLKSAIRDVPFDVVKSELGERGIALTTGELRGRGSR